MCGIEVNYQFQVTTYGVNIQYGQVKIGIVYKICKNDLNSFL